MSKKITVLVILTVITALLFGFILLQKQQGNVQGPGSATEQATANGSETTATEYVEETVYQEDVTPPMTFPPEEETEATKPSDETTASAETTPSATEGREEPDVSEATESTEEADSETETETGLEEDELPPIPF